MAASLARSNYVSFSTLRKNGDWVNTPVWFAPDGDTYYIFSAGDAGKVKRLRNFSQCRVAPCTVTGTATGDYRALRELMDDRPHRIRIGVDDARTFAATLVQRGLVDGVSVHADTILADTTDVDAFGRAVAGLSRDLDTRLREVVPLDDDLESVFRYLVERR